MNKFTENEAEIYNEESINRDKIREVMSHVKNGPSIEREKSIAAKNIKQKGGDILEIGSKVWHKWMYKENIKVDGLKCINISKKEIKKGRKKAQKNGVKIDFKVADAHKMPFEDNKFDIVFGGSVIHHLDIPRATKEINRVLKPGGLMIFSEPLGVNPVGVLFRYLTPEARTPDERPLFPSDLEVINTYFEAERYYIQLFEVPFGILSRYIFSRPNNILLEGISRLDNAISKIPFAGYLFRKILIVGRK